MRFRNKEKERLEQSNDQLTLDDVTSVNLTMMSGGVQYNVLPSSLTASFDVRLTPSLSLEEWKHMLDTWAEEAGGGITVSCFLLPHSIHWLSRSWIVSYFDLKESYSRIGIHRLVSAV
ncbi:unnamed protein product [Echinostoma caproni]|uniref:M20_dimer domain-containing protein n=1 Tax=Echinostoma caproni TaxID=27848 RepID=A0A183B4N7_9TREM|nr:unnamed protein product [Echinostoma caproni]